MPATYSTISGDTWDMIAYRVYGDELLMDVLLQANPQHLETAIFPAGVQIVVPETEKSVRSSPPPWRSE